MEVKIQELGSRLSYATVIINHLFQPLMIDAQTANKIINLSLPSVCKLIKELGNLKILEKITGGKREKLFVFKDYLKVFK